MRSFTEPLGLKDYSLAQMAAFSFPGNLLSRTMGVQPIKLRALSTLRLFPALRRLIDYHYTKISEVLKNKHTLGIGEIFPPSLYRLLILYDLVF